MRTSLSTLLVSCASFSSVLGLPLLAQRDSSSSSFATLEERAPLPLDDSYAVQQLAQRDSISLPEFDAPNGIDVAQLLYFPSLSTSGGPFKAGGSITVSWNMTKPYDWSDASLPKTAVVRLGYTDPDSVGYHLDVAAPLGNISYYTGSGSAELPLPTDLATRSTYFLTAGSTSVTSAPFTVEAEAAAVVSSSSATPATSSTSAHTSSSTTAAVTSTTVAALKDVATSSTTSSSAAVLPTASPLVAAVASSSSTTSQSAPSLTSSSPSSSLTTSSAPSSSTTTFPSSSSATSSSTSASVSSAPAVVASATSAVAVAASGNVAAAAATTSSSTSGAGRNAAAGLSVLVGAGIALFAF